jgi:hypothetical protein
MFSELFTIKLDENPLVERPSFILLRQGSNIAMALTPVSSSRNGIQQSCPFGREMREKYFLFKPGWTNMNHGMCDAGFLFPATFANC